MTQQTTLYKELAPDDITLIAKLTGHDTEYVHKVRDGEEENNVILMIARDILAMRAQLSILYLNKQGIHPGAGWPEIERHCAAKLTEPILDGLSEIQHMLRDHESVTVRKKLAQLYAQLETYTRWLSSQRLIIKPVMEAVAVYPAAAYALLDLRGPYADKVDLEVGDEAQLVYTDPVLLKLLIRTMVYSLVAVVCDPGLVLGIEEIGANEIGIRASGASFLEEEALLKYMEIQLEAEAECARQSMNGPRHSTPAHDVAQCHYLAQLLGGRMEWQQRQDEAVLCAVLPIRVA